MSKAELLDCPAPAKLNLFLHVTGQRSDGYHLLQTAFQLIDYADKLDFYRTDNGELQRLNQVPGIAAEDDLVIRAARLLQTQTHCSYGAAIRVHKQLPMGGGLGGGSSDAATTLMALNHLWQTGLNRRQLMQLGLQLGADVPFFIFGQNAFAEGVGEELQPLSTPARYFVVIEPGVQVPTPLIFKDQGLTRNTPAVRIADFPSDAAANWKNDLQAVASRLFPEVDKALVALAKYGDAKMTGSGACVFCAFATLDAAQQALQELSNDWKAWIVKSLDFHPMYALLND